MDNSWVELYPPELLRRLQRKRIVVFLLFWAILLAGLLFCVRLCLHADTSSDRVLLGWLVLVSTVCGWVCIALKLEWLTPLRRAAEHTAHMYAGEREILRGIVTVTDELVQIRRSILIRTVLLHDGETTHRLSVYAPFATRLGATPREMSLACVHSYVSAFMPAAPASVPGSVGRLTLRALRHIAATLHHYVLWLLIAVFLSAFVYTHVTDTTPAKKVTVFIDVPAAEEAALASALEQSAPESIRMVKVRLFSYAFMESRTLQSADIFLVRAGNAAQYLSDFQPLEPWTDGEYYTVDGVIWGIRVYDAASGSGAAASYIQYAAPGSAAEDYYLFFGKESLHTGEQDTAAFQIAKALMELS